MRLALPFVAVALTAACVQQAAPASGTYAQLNAPVPGVPMAFAPAKSKAAIFEDDDLNVEVIQVYAFEESFGSGVFIQFPAALAANAGSYALDPSADPAVYGWFGTSDNGDDDDVRWQFALRSATLNVVTPATVEGMTLAVAVSGGTFVFENEHGVQNGAVTALLGNMDPPLTAELEDDDLDGCDLP